MESIPENLESLLRSLLGDVLKNDNDSKKVRHSSGQVMRLWLHAKRTEQGYRGAKVLVGPSREEEAYVAAVLAFYGEKMERESDEKDHQSDKMARASNAIFFSEAMRWHASNRLRGSKEATPDDVYQAMQQLGFSRNDPSEETRNRDFFDGFRLGPLYNLLRYFRPELDSMSVKERICLLERTIGYVNDYLEALQRLTSFLQYGETGAYEGLATKQVTRAEKQVRAAELRELMRTEQGAPLPYRKIGRLLGERPTAGQDRRSYEARIGQMVKIGRGILKQALGEQGYQDYMEEKRAELEHWQTLTEDEQREIQMEENFGISPGDTYEIVEP